MAIFGAVTGLLAKAEVAADEIDMLITTCVDGTTD